MHSFMFVSFAFINIAIMPLWFGLLFFPRKQWVSLAIDWFFFAAAVIFVVNLVPGVRAALPVILKPTLPGVAALLSTPNGALGAWTHFVIGDLFVGRWISEDAHARSIARLWVLPILVLTLLFGPVGLLSYFIVRSFTGIDATRRHRGAPKGTM